MPPRVCLPLTLTAALVVAIPAFADPPQLSGPEGPDIETRFGPIRSDLVASERGLAIRFDDLADVDPVAVVNGVEEFVFPSYLPDSGLNDFATNFPIITVVVSAFAHTATTTTVTDTVAVDGGVRVQARIAATGAIIGTTLAATLDEAVDTALALPQVQAVAPVVTQTTANGATLTTDATTTRMITGRDTYVGAYAIIGPEAGAFGGGQEFRVTGSFSERINGLGRCTIALTACEGGVQANFAAFHYAIIGFAVQDLYIAEMVTETVTTVQEYFLNLFLAGGDGVPHVGAQGAGLEVADRFLALMGREAAVRGDTAQVSRGAAVKRPRFFAEFGGGQGSFGQIGGVEASDWAMSDLTGGAVFDVGGDWTLGVAVETGRWDWSGDGATAEGDSRKFGVFAAWQRGSWTVAAEGFVGQADVETRDALGVTADYDVDLGGLGIEAGYAIAAGDWTITPQAALRYVVWDAPEVTDSVGGVIAASRVEQLRPEIGIVAARRFVLDNAVFDLGLDARVWTVTGDRTGVVAGGVLTGGPEPESGGSLGVRADWQVAPGAVVSGAVTTRFGDGGPDTFASLGLRMVF